MGFEDGDSITKRPLYAFEDGWRWLREIGESDDRLDMWKKIIGEDRIAVVGIDPSTIDMVITDLYTECILGASACAMSRGNAGSVSLEKKRRVPCS